MGGQLPAEGDGKMRSNGKLLRWALGLLAAVALLHLDLASAQADPVVNSNRAVISGADDAGNGNNGHGNNQDGVDSSNPGNAPFQDSDPSVDDEMGVRGGDAQSSGHGANGHGKKKGHGHGHGKKR